MTLSWAGLLLLSFPMAGGIVVAAIAIHTRYTVVVHNASPQAWEEVRVFGGGCDESLGSIPSGGTFRRSFWIQHDDELKFRAVRARTIHTKTIDGYVTGGFAGGGHATVTINPDGTISVSHGSG